MVDGGRENGKSGRLENGRTVGRKQSCRPERSEGPALLVVLSAAKDLHVQVVRSLRSLRTTSLSPVCPSAAPCPPVRLSDCPTVVQYPAAPASLSRWSAAPCR